MIKLNKDLIYEYQQNREPYLMIDEAINVVPGKSAIGYKDFNEDEWFFKVHWPKDPNVPGMLQVEALTQMSALSILTLEGNKGQIMYLNTVDKVKFYKKIIPNSRLEIETKVLSFKRGLALCEGNGSVNGNLVCKASVSLVLIKDLSKYNIKKNI